MLSIVPILIIVACLIVIIFIIVKKFPQLVNLDVNNLSEEKFSKKKKEIISKRINETRGRAVKAAEKYLLPVRKIFGKWQLKFRIYVGKIDRLWHHEQTIKQKLAMRGMTSREIDQKLSTLIQEAEQNLQIGIFDKAEELFISAIKIDVKSAAAYRGLGDTYFAKHSLEEARETYRFLLRLEPDDDSVLVKMAEIAESQGDIEEAIGYYQRAAVINDSFSPRFYHLAELLLKINQPEVAREAITQAVELEPQNPKYLDLLIEIAILCNDKELALSGYGQMRSVNPENQKLDSLKDRINKIGEFAGGRI